MNEAPTTWALIVGIDVYDDPGIPALQGAVADALAAYQWLRDLGVPDKQILLNASPSPAVKAALDVIRPGCPPARSMDIDNSLVELEQVVGGTRLFLFLCGHGLYEPTSERLFLAQEFTQRRPANLGIELYVPRLLEMPFARQFLFMDGCQNQPYSQTERQKIAGVMYGGRTGFAPKPGNGLVACYAAAKDQLALEVGGRGLFTRHLLAALDPVDPLAEAVDLDFDSGARAVDLRKVLFECVQGKVHDEAWAQSPRMDQTPELETHGAAQAAKTHPIFRLADEQTASVQVLIDPASALADIRRVRISAEEPPQWDLRVPRLEGGPLALPVTSRLPLGLRVTAQCSVRSGAPWNLVPARYDFEVAGDQTLSFALQPKETAATVRGPVPLAPSTDRIQPPITRGDYESAPPPPPPTSPDDQPKVGFAVSGETAPEPEMVIELRTQTPDGATTYNAFSYDVVARQLGFSKGVGDGGEVAPGVRLHHHERGPDFAFRADAIDAGYAVASQWADAIQRATPSEVRIATRVRGDAAPGPEPGLRIELPPDGPSSLAGFVTGRLVVWVGLPGDEPVEPLWREGTGPGRWTLDELALNPEMKMEPGPVRIRLDLPWGSWTSVVRIPERGEAMVSLPAVVGTPPLRVALYREAGRPGTALLGAEGRAPAAWLRHGLGGKTGPALETAEPRSAAWALRPAKLDGSASGQTLAEIDLEDGRRALFPLMKGRVLALDLTRGGLRVEALSQIPSPSWDLLIAAGRLDALGVDDVMALTYGKWEDWLLGLAGAYAVYARPSAHESAHLQVVLENLTHLAEKGKAQGQRVLDLDLLWAAFRSPGSKSPSADAARRLLPWAEKRAVPVLRWGVTIALQLLAGLGDDEPFAGWRAALAAIEPRLSPISVWTAWTEPA